MGERLTGATKGTIMFANEIARGGGGNRYIRRSMSIGRTEDVKVK